MSTRFSRRGFLLSIGAVGAGLSLGIRPAAAASASAGVDALEPNLFVRIVPDGTVTITCHRAEMGQGIRSTLPWIIAGELGADYDRVVVQQATGDKAYGDQNTDGSTSIRLHLPMLREVGATAREMLISAAAARWGTGRDGLVAADHQITDPSTGRSLGFGELALEAAAQKVPRDVPLRPKMAHLDKPMPLLDGKAIVTGSAVFGADTPLPGLLVAMIARPPDLYGAVASVDDSAARAVPGVTDVIVMNELGGAPAFKPVGGVAVVATNTWAAMEGRRALKITWAHGENGGVSSTEDLAAMRASLAEEGKVKRSTGDAARALEAAADTFSATYQIPHLVHAPMEPPAAVAWYKGDSCEIWAPVQEPQRTRSNAAGIVGLKDKHVTVHQTLLGGGFGRKGKPDFASEAAFLSKAVGAPIRVQWDRADDVRHSYYHASSVQRLEAGFDGDGKLTAWRHRISSPSIATIYLPFVKRLLALELGQGVLDLALDVPNVRVETLPAPARLRIGWMRSVYNINHGFAIQSFIDELARKQGVSAPEMLKTVLGPPRILTKQEAGAKIPGYGGDHDVDIGRWHAVIDDVVAQSGYTPARDADAAFGFGAHASFTSYVGAVVRVVKGPQGRPKVDEAWISVDAGQIANPDRARAQMEGAVIFGASVALHGEITFKDGAVEQSNFHDYPVLRMNEAPRAIHVRFLNTDADPGGIGEPGVPPIAPAITAAWFTLTGERVRTLPIRA